MTFYQHHPNNSVSDEEFLNGTTANQSASDSSSYLSMKGTSNNINIKLQQNLLNFLSNNSKNIQLVSWDRNTSYFKLAIYPDPAIHNTSAAAALSSNSEVTSMVGNMVSSMVESMVGSATSITGSSSAGDNEGLSVEAATSSISSNVSTSIPTSMPTTVNATTPIGYVKIPVSDFIANDANYSSSSSQTIQTKWYDIMATTRAKRNSFGNKSVLKVKSLHHSVNICPVYMI